MNRCAKWILIISEVQGMVGALTIMSADVIARETGGKNALAAESFDLMITKCLMIYCARTLLSKAIA